MFGRHLLRNLRSAWHSNKGWQSSNCDYTRQNPTRHARYHQLNHVRGVATAAAGNVVQLLGRNGGYTLGMGTAMLVSGGAAAAWNSNQHQHEHDDFDTARIEWVQQLAAKHGMLEVPIPGQMLRKHPVGQLISEEDHLVRFLLQYWQVLRSFVLALLTGSSPVPFAAVQSCLFLVRADLAC